MAIYHLHAQVIGRTGGRSAVAAAAYRSGEKLVDKTTGQVFNYRPKGWGVKVSGIVLPDNAPEWAKDRAELWSRVEKKEARKNSQFCREFDIALPHEATRQEQEQLVREFIADNFTALGLGADFAIHAGSKNGKSPPNDHAHVLVLTRAFDQAQNDGWATNKNREIDRPDWLQKVRKSWEKILNDYLQKRGLPLVSCETLEAQGITDRLPQIHQGVTAAAMERKGKTPDRKRTKNGEIAGVAIGPQELERELENDPVYEVIAAAKKLAEVAPGDWWKIAKNYKAAEEKFGDDPGFAAIKKAFELVDPVQREEEWQRLQKLEAAQEQPQEQQSVKKQSVKNSQPTPRKKNRDRGWEW